MELVQSYVDQITADTSPQERLARTKDLVADITSQLGYIGHYDADTVAAIIKALLRVALDRTHTNTEIRDYVISPEVCQVVQSLITGPVTASDVLWGMTEAVREEGVGFDGIFTFSAVLIYRWFVRKDNPVFATSPGFVIELFEFFLFCGDRQEDVCGNRDVLLESMDALLHSLVRGTLPRETAESINRGGRDGETALHHACSVLLLPCVTEAILTHKQTDPRARNKAGESALTALITRRFPLGDDPLSTARLLLAHSKLDVSSLDNGYKTAMDHCLDHLDGSPETVTRALELLRLISQHRSCTSAMIQRALAKLVDWEVPSGLQDLYTAVIAKLAESTNYDINTEIKNGMTLAHIALSKNQVDILMGILEIDGFDPNVQDEVGNTILYYVCEHLPMKEAITVIDHPTVAWDFRHRNCVDQTVLDYYKKLDMKKNPIVMGKLEQRVRIGSAVSEGRQRVRWIRFKSSGKGTVKPSTATIIAKEFKPRVYDTRHAFKGKACIISIHTFTDPVKLANLDGYKKDDKDLAELWDGLGFQVLIPEKWNPKGGCLTAEELQTAVKEFASDHLEKSDQCAVLCILSHGGEGFLYGSDGATVQTCELLQAFDNINCIKMAGKPKVVVMQACQGDSIDHGVHVRASASPLAIPAAGPFSDSHLPTVSDIIVCTPAIPGSVSFVSDKSIYLRNLIKIFSEHAWEEDINTLLTWVNNDVSGQNIRTTKPGTSKVADHKQMPQFVSTLRKKLYFFPCPGGKNGADWQ